MASSQNKNMGLANIIIKNRGALEISYRENSSDQAVINDIWRDGCYQTRNLARHSDIIESYKTIVSSNKTPIIIDAGANIGASSLFFSLSYKKSNVIAIEPEQENYDILSLNTEKFPSIHCLRAALSSTDGFLNLVDPGHGEWGFRTFKEDESITAKTIGRTPSLSVDSILEKYRSTHVPFIIKIDIEGGESDLFSKNTEWIDEFQVLIIELHDWMLPGQRNSANFLKAISLLDRDFVYAGENIFSIRNNR